MGRWKRPCPPRRAARALSALSVGRGHGCPGLRCPRQTDPPRGTGTGDTDTSSGPRLSPAARSPLLVPFRRGGRHTGGLSVGSDFRVPCVLAQSPTSGLQMLPGIVPLLLPLSSYFSLAERADRFKVAEGAPSLSSLSKKQNFVPNCSSVCLL